MTVSDDRVTGPWSRDNLVRPLIDGSAYFRRLREELSDTRAGDQVYVVAWRGDAVERLDDGAATVVAELVRAARAGVSVNGLVWRSHLDRINRQARNNHALVDVLRQAGASVVLDQRVRVAGSHHQKFVVIRRPDRPSTDVAFVGGVDLSNSRRDDGWHHGDPQAQPVMAAAYGPRPAWHDAQLEIRGPAVAAVEECFRERFEDPTPLRYVPWLWMHDKLRPRNPATPRLPDRLPAPPPCGTRTVQLLRTYPRKIPPYPFAPRGERSVARGYAKALRNARELVYVEDQFLWSSTVADVFADALRREPGLRLVAVVPHHADVDGMLQVHGGEHAHRLALERLHAAGGDRVEVYELESTFDRPVYAHAKICVVDDAWAAVGSANLNRRSWTHDCELTAAVVDQPSEDRGASAPEGSGTSRTFARELRLRLWREHLGREEGDDEDLLDVPSATAALTKAADALDTWHRSGRRGPRPPGHLRRHPTPDVPARHRVWAAPAARVLLDPDGRSLRDRVRSRW